MVERLTTKRILVYIYATILAVFFCVPSAQAQTADGTATATNNQGITISPPIREFSVDAGKAYPEIIKLSNPSQSIIELYPLAMNFMAEGETGQPKFTVSETDGQSFALAGWITFKQSKIAIAPQQVVDFTYTINVPANAEDGGHYGVVFFSTQPPDITGSTSQVSVSSMIGSLVMITTGNSSQEKLSLSTFEFPKLLFSGDLNIKTRLNNGGNVHLKPTGEISIKSNITNLSDAIVFNPERGNVLPDTTRSFSNSWHYNTFKNIGPHTVELKLTYGADNQTISAQGILWILPWWLLISLLVLITVIIVLITVIKRKKRKDFKKYFKVPV